MSERERPQDAEFWQAVRELDVATVPDEIRRHNGDAWAQCARMEHASIASFSKFSLQLMALGAPPNLVAECHEAALDEIAHARISFAIASRFLGTPLGPGPLPIAGHVMEFEGVLRVCQATVVDGCIGESLAAAEAQAARREAELPAIAAALAIVERDETRHAQLAWSAIAWLLSTGDEGLAVAVRAAFDAELSKVEAGATDTAHDREDFAGYGHIPPGRRGALRARCARELLRPAVAELFAMVRTRAR